MRDLVRTFGAGLTTVIVGLVALWFLALILLPQVSMVQRAFTVEDRAGRSALLAVEIERLYVRQFAITRERDALEKSSAPAPVQAPSPFAPSLNAAPSAAPSPSPSPSPSDPFARAASPLPADPEAVAVRLAELEIEAVAVATQIADLEAQETRSDARDTRLSLENFTSMSSIHAKIFVSTLGYALMVTVLALIVCYPVAYAVATAKTSERAALLMLLLVVPYAINELLRIFAWVLILEKQGLINSLLSMLGFIDLSVGEGVRFVASNWAVFTVMIYAYVLFMVFPIYNTIETLDKNQIEAARDLGASNWRIHTRVVIPHAKPGIAVGSIMTFMLSAGSIAGPEIVGRGMHPDWFSQVIYRRFFETNAWNQGAAYSLALLAACLVFIMAVMAFFKVGIRDIAK